MKHALVVAAAAAWLVSCVVANPPVVSQQTFSASAGSIRVVAVMPFYPRPEMQRFNDVDGESVASMVSTYVTEALKAEGLKVIPPSDLELTFANDGRATPRRDQRAAAEAAAVAEAAAAAAAAAAPAEAEAEPVEKAEGDVAAPAADESAPDSSTESAE